MRTLWLCLSVFALGCTHGPDRVESATAAPPSAEARVSAMATVARVCSATDLDPRVVSERDRGCSGGDDRACTALGIAHLCGANGERNEAAAAGALERACRMNNAEGCRLLEAARVVAPRSHVASLLD
jgi:TPR repeat protein